MPENCCSDCYFGVSRECGRFGHKLKKNHTACVFFIHKHASFVSILNGRAEVTKDAEGDTCAFGPFTKTEEAMKWALHLNGRA